MSFVIPRQACRCGHVFRTLQAHQAHADLCEPLPHDDPADVGLVLVEGEWEIKGRVPVPAEPVKAAPTTPKAPKPAYVRAADRPSTDFLRTCTICNAEFERPRKRGRPPTKCEDCR